MKLSELLKYDDIVIQCHDNPDADAIASGYGLYTYFKNQGKQVRLIYGGRYAIQKSNLVLMVSELQIPIEHVESLPIPQLLVTVDCQYGEGNVTRFEAEHVAVIDHHQVTGELPEHSEVRSNLGACATLVREMLKDEGVDLNEDTRVATALYYGLLTDTNQFTEISHPLDKDLRDDAAFERSLITRFRNSNLSLKELEIAGMALIGYDYNETYRYAVAEAKPCDPNILGMISDLMLEVDAVDTCLVYSVLPFGVKISVRSCIKEVKASELAEFIVQGIGSGGGHLEKAGGFIQMELLDKEYERYCKWQEIHVLREFGADVHGIHPDTDGINGFLKWRMDDYFDDVEIIHAKDYEIDTTEMIRCQKRKLPLGFVKAADLFEPGSTVCVRTLEGDLDVTISEDIYIMIGIKGEIYPNKREKFKQSYQVQEEPYHFEGEYEPIIKDAVEGKNISLIPYASTCIPTRETYIYVKQLDHRVKVFTEWDKEKYMLGQEGDYLAVREDDKHDIYVIEQSIFEKTYARV